MCSLTSRSFLKVEANADMQKQVPTEAELDSMRSRIEALVKVQNGINGKDCFTHDEHGRVDAELIAAQTKLRTMEALFAEYSQNVKNTIERSEIHLSEREEALNVIFAQKGMKEQGDLMEIFMKQHTHLRHTRMLGDDNASKCAPDERDDKSTAS